MKHFCLFSCFLLSRIFTVYTFTPTYPQNEHRIALSAPLLSVRTSSSSWTPTEPPNPSAKQPSRSKFVRLSSWTILPVVSFWRLVQYCFAKVKRQDSSAMTSKVRNTLARTKKLLYRSENLLESSIEIETSEGVKEKLLETERVVLQAETMIEASLGESSDVLRDSPSTTADHIKTPVGSRWAVAGDGVDLSGNWELIVTDQFRTDYDAYLTALGQPMLVRSVALGIVSLTTELVEQAQRGKLLSISGKNVRGIWDRTLVSSGTEPGVDTYTPLQIPVMSADSERVEAESWWEGNGRYHISWLRGFKKYGGGAFESRRYLNNDEYVCESTFHPTGASRKPIHLVWRFRRQISASKDVELSTR